jgi:hypothetical protein
MAKRATPIRLDEKLLKSLDRFVRDWNQTGAPSTNRTFVMTTAIEQYLKNWRPTLKKYRGANARVSGRVLDFPRLSAKRPIKDQPISKQAM